MGFNSGFKGLNKIFFFQALLDAFSETAIFKNIYTTDAQNLLLHVSTLQVCHHQGFFTVVK